MTQLIKLPIAIIYFPLLILVALLYGSIAGLFFKTVGCIMQYWRDTSKRKQLSLLILPFRMVTGIPQGASVVFRDGLDLWLYRIAKEDPSGYYRDLLEIDRKVELGKAKWSDYRGVL